jgi:hypothetical protein
MKNRLFLQSAIHDLLSYPLHSRFFASIRGSKTLNESALRGRIALPGGLDQDLESIAALAESMACNNSCDSLMHSM